MHCNRLSMMFFAAILTVGGLGYLLWGCRAVETGAILPPSSTRGPMSGRQAIFVGILSLAFSAVLWRAYLRGRRK